MAKLLTLVSLALVSAGLGAQPEPARLPPPPATEALVAARAQLAQDLVELLEETHGASKTIDLLLARAVATRDIPAPRRFALFEQAWACCLRSTDLARAFDTLTDWGGHFAIDQAQRRADTLRQLEATAAVPKPAAVFAWLDVAAHAARAATDKAMTEALRNATNRADTLGDRVLLASVDRTRKELRAVREPLGRNL